jgi:hypothetical protein
MPCEAQRSHPGIFRLKCGCFRHEARHYELPQCYSGLFALGSLLASAQ